MLLKKYLNFRIISVITLIVILALACWQWFEYKSFLRLPLKVNSTDSILEVSHGQGINLLVSKLRHKGVINQVYFAKLYYWLNPEFKLIKAGEYQIGTDETFVTLLQKLIDGKVVQYTLTIVEGSSSYHLLDKLNGISVLKQDFSLQPDNLVSELNLKTNHIEGMFFPDTYHYTKGSSSLDLLKRSNVRMMKVLTSEWSKRAEGLPYKTPYEALIMASIIEKETGVRSERKKIAGVFVRRLNKKMRLQTDPTVIYGVGPQFNGDITYKHLRTRTPYNTYLINGLPPTPIALPGKESIHAALHPEDGDTLYFVASGDGGHYFSRTLKEHNKAVQRFLRKSKQ